MTAITISIIAVFLLFAIFFLILKNQDEKKSAFSSVHIEQEEQSEEIKHAIKEIKNVVYEKDGYVIEDYLFKLDDSLSRLDLVAITNQGIFVITMCEAQGKLLKANYDDANWKMKSGRSKKTIPNYRTKVLKAEEQILNDLDSEIDYDAFIIFLNADVNEIESVFCYTLNEALLKIENVLDREKKLYSESSVYRYYSKLKKCNNRRRDTENN